MKQPKGGNIMSNKFIYDGIDYLYKVQVKGEELLNKEEPTIYISNQVSIVDFRLILNRLPENTYMVASEDFVDKYPVLQDYQDNLLIVKLGTPKSIKKIVNTLKEGNSILIYPEGTITRTGTLMALQKGVSFFARKSGVKIQPLIIDGMERSPLSYYGNSGYTSKKHLPSIIISIGEAFYLPEETLPKIEQMDWDNEFIYGKMNDLLLMSKSRENRNLWNDLMDAVETYGLNKITIEDEEKNTYSYRQLLNRIQILSRVVRDIENCHNIGVFLPESLDYVGTVFSLFKAKKRVVILPVTNQEHYREMVDFTSAQLILTERKFISQLGLEETFKQMEDIVRIIYIDDLRLKTSLLDRIKRHKRTSEDNEQEVVFLEYQNDEWRGTVFNHEQLYMGMRQAALTVGRQDYDILFSLIPFSKTLGFTFGMLFPLLSGFRFISAYLSSSSSLSEKVYSLSPTMVLASKMNLTDMLKNGHGQHFNFTHSVFCPMEKVDEEFQLEWIKKFKGIVYEGYYNKQFSSFLSLNTKIQYKHNTLGRIMAGSKFEDESLISPTKCKGALDEQGYVIISDSIQMEELKNKYLDFYIQ